MITFPMYVAIVAWTVALGVIAVAVCEYTARHPRRYPPCPPMPPRDFDTEGRPPMACSAHTCWGTVLPPWSPPPPPPKGTSPFTPAGIDQTRPQTHQRKVGAAFALLDERGDLLRVIVAETERAAWAVDCSTVTGRSDSFSVEWHRVVYQGLGRRMEPGSIVVTERQS